MIMKLLAKKCEESTKQEYLPFWRCSGATDDRMTEKIVNVETASQAKAAPVLPTDLYAQ